MMHIRDDRGLTIAELMVVAALMSLIVGLTYFVLNSVTSMADGSIARAAAADHSQLFVERIGRELRAAMEPEEKKPAFAQNSRREIVFFTDVDGDTKPERVRYWYDSSAGAVFRQEAKTTDAITPFRNFGSYSTPEKVIPALAPGWTEPFFEYYNISNSAVSFDANEAQRLTIARVEVTIQAHVTSGEREAVSVATVTARPRSILNSLGGK
ncbi:MAG: hypothetical protein RBS78_05935 [Coriobacteriia bacterium]|nr:hypothetical protein [Coriobacteriia bacterium]